MKKNLLALFFIIFVAILCMIIYFTIEGTKDGIKLSGNNDTRRDQTSTEKNTTKVSGISLADNTVRLEVKPNVENIQKTQENLLTNTTKIVVTADNLIEDAEVTVFLYSVIDNKDNLIGSTKLPSDENRNKVIFANLTSSREYKIGAFIKNAEDDIVLTIMDKEK